MIPLQQLYIFLTLVRYLFLLLPFEFPKMVRKEGEKVKTSVKPTKCTRDFFDKSRASSIYSLL
jgi:hypothetical protein